MHCSECRTEVSARLDDEGDPAIAPAVDAHLVGCADCRRWVERTQVLHRHIRVRPVEAPLDRTDAILSAVPLDIRPRAARPSARLALAGIGLAHVAVAIPALAFADKERAPIHLAREVGAFELALGVALMVAAWRPRVAAGLVPAAAAAAGGVALAATADLLAGRATVSTEAHHLLTFLGLGLLGVLVRRRSSHQINVSQ
jgi:predicted anti-sigma-YlaC factor YlaD